MSAPLNKSFQWMNVRDPNLYSLKWSYPGRVYSFTRIVCGFLQSYMCVGIPWLMWFSSVVRSHVCIIWYCERRGTKTQVRLSVYMQLVLFSILDFFFSVVVRAHFLVRDISTDRELWRLFTRKTSIQSEISQVFRQPTAQLLSFNMLLFVLFMSGPRCL